MVGFCVICPWGIPEPFAQKLQNRKQYDSWCPVMLLVLGTVGPSTRRQISVLMVKYDKSGLDDSLNAFKNPLARWVAQTGFLTQAGDQESWSIRCLLRCSIPVTSPASWCAHVSGIHWSGLIYHLRSAGTSQFRHNQIQILNGTNFKFNWWNKKVCFSSHLKWRKREECSLFQWQEKSSAK